MSMLRYFHVDDGTECRKSVTMHGGVWSCTDHGRVVRSDSDMQRDLERMVADRLPPRRDPESEPLVFTCEHQCFVTRCPHGCHDVTRQVQRDGRLETELVEVHREGAQRFMAPRNELEAAKDAMYAHFLSDKSYVVEPPPRPITDVHLPQRVAKHPECPGCTCP